MQRAGAWLVLVAGAMLMVVHLGRLAMPAPVRTSETTGDPRHLLARRLTSVQ